MYQNVLNFWFEELEPYQWWDKSDELDATITERFAHIHASATRGELFDWRHSAKGALAEVIVLDQFSRNIYRNDPRAFEPDAMALVLAQTAIDKGYDRELSMVEVHFLYLPFMHSESLHIQEEALKLYTQLGNEDALNFEIQHKSIIEQFGRYPHRNHIIGRDSTPAEIAFLKQPNSSF